MDNYITRKTYEVINSENQSLQKRLLNQSKIIRQAIDSGGGTHDNAMYDSALNDQKVMAAKHDELSKILNSPIFIDDIGNTSNETISIGKKVKIKDIDTCDINEYRILGSADVIYNKIEGAISFTTPVAKSLIGKSIADIVIVKLPFKDKEYEIMSISHWDE